MSELGKLLKNLRGNKSLREASKITGISHNYLSIVERGVDPRSGAPVSPTPETLEKLSEAYNYPYKKLMQMAGYIKEETEEEKTEDEDMHPAKKLLSYIEQGLTNEQIRKRSDFFVEFMQLNDEQADEFMSWVRWQLSTKKQEPVSASKSEEPSHEQDR